MEEMIREQVMLLMGTEIENLIAELVKKKVEESVEDWYINHNLKEYVKVWIDDEYVIDNNSIVDEIDTYIEGCINRYAY